MKVLFTRKLKWRIASYVMCLSLVVSSCAKVPITGRKQVNLLPESEMLSMSLDNYNQFLKENKVVSGTKDAQLVKDVGKNISNAVEKYMTQNNLKDRIAGYNWEFNLVDDKTVNAWCMPGGKVVFYSGIMPICKNATGVAVVMGHEIAHAVARHGNERMSQMLAVQMGGIALDVALSNKPEETRNLFLTAYGLGSQLGVLLPYSRLHESEADHMGLIFMAMAGYDPHEAVAFWQRMEAQSNGSPPEFLSTHPSHQTRIKDLNKHMSEALKYYNPKK